MTLFHQQLIILPTRHHARCLPHDSFRPRVLVIRKSPCNHRTDCKYLSCQIQIHTQMQPDDHLVIFVQIVFPRLEVHAVGPIEPAVQYPRFLLVCHNQKLLGIKMIIASLLRLLLLIFLTRNLNQMIVTVIQYFKDLKVHHSVILHPNRTSSIFHCSCFYCFNSVFI